MNLNEIKRDCAVKQKKGLHFILASIIIWIAVSFVHISSLPILTKNLFTFCCTAHLLPYSWLYSSKSYMFFSILIPLTALIIGLKSEPFILATTMIIVEIIFSICLITENKRLISQL